MGLFTLALARRADTASWAGRDVRGEVLLLLVGWSLIAAGLRLLGRPTDRRAGVLFVAGGFGWFVGDWNNQYAGSSVIFTAGLVFSTVAPVLVSHAVLRFGDPRLDWFGRVGVTVAYASTAALAGVVPALFFDPARQGCAGCPANLLAVHSDPAMVERLGRTAVVAGPIWCALLAVGLGVALARATPARRRLIAPALVPGIGFLAAVGTMYLRSAGAGFLPVNSTNRLLWAMAGCLLLLVALGTLWPLLQRQLTRARVARLVVDAAGAPPVGGLRSLLSRSLGDPSLRVLYRVGDGTWVDADGRPATPGDEQAVTSVVRGAETVALLAHRPGLLADPDLAGEISATARLVLDNERLQALTRAQLTDLRASRARIVRSGDAERRRLERDLHDGAQQQLVALSLALQLAALRAGDAEEAARLMQARNEVATVLAQLRQLARGIYPRELADEGLAAALETLAEGSAEPLRIDAVPSRRFPPAVEAAAYQVVAYLNRASGGSGVRVTAEYEDDHLTVAVATAAPPEDLVAMEDRVGALGGRLSLGHTESGYTTIRAVLPCGS
ncbi:MAG: hypothetical protein H0V10_06450 [Geodermatophilaceae bacterium]|nr:hypothetical protein [Geodermatophilaceae bacterium]